MFVQRPQTTHVPRHYTNTVRKTNNKNVDKENAGALPSKTPSKGALKVGTGMLVPNTVRLGKSTMDTKGKGKEDDIGMLSSELLIICVVMVDNKHGHPLIPSSQEIIR